MKRSFLLFCLCLNLALSAQTNTNIILFDLSITAKGVELFNPINITPHKGYDNQPCFYKTSIYYSSEVDSGVMDIKRYDLIKKTTTTVTHTEDNEFSPTITPDGKFFSCILQRKNGKQDLVKYPISGGEPSLIIDNLKVGYHAWVDINNLLLFVLEDDKTNRLHYVDLLAGHNEIIPADTIGRALQKIPGQHALSFINKTPKGWMINRLDAASKKITTTAAALPNSEYHVWTRNGLLLMSDGKEFYYKKPGRTGDWNKIHRRNEIPMGKISRLAINQQNTKLAVVVAE